jgi:hypothetical protein
MDDPDKDHPIRPSPLPAFWRCGLFCLGVLVAGSSRKKSLSALSWNRGALGRVARSGGPAAVSGGAGGTHIALGSTARCAE